MSMQGNLGIERMCGLAQVSRAGFYRWLVEREPDAEEMQVRAAIQKIAIEHKRRYGYRRVTAELRQRGMIVNHKRVVRLMRADNLLALQRRAFLSTTDSAHSFEVYFNLAARMTLSGINQLWIADITYIRLQREFVYLAVVLDAFSRKVIGWSLDRSLSSTLPTIALQRAITNRKPRPGLVHHSDRGIQYASEEYGKLLDEHQMIPSMSRPANPYDNARCESFIKTLKYEEIYAGEYTSLENLQRNLTDFIDRYYNRQRLHSALGYRSPEAFETSLPSEPCLGSKVSFSRHQEIFRSDEDYSSSREPLTNGSSNSDHRLDESPTGYSLPSWSPPLLGSASPARVQSILHQDV